MKKVYLFFSLILFCCVQTINAQDYKPFPNANAMWREFFGGFEFNCEDYQYVITGDTIINDVTYHKLQKSGVIYAAGGFGGCNWSAYSGINDYAGCFRNDIPAEKVYFFDGETERLLYDFSLSIGDTIPKFGEYDYPTTIISIDSIELGGILHKRFFVNNQCNIHGSYIIEGIGSTYGLFFASRCHFESDSQLLCFSINDETIYPSTGTNCTLVNAIEDHTQDKATIALYPNPAYSTFQIKGIDNFENIAVSIYNAYGQRVMQEQKLNKDGLIHIETLTEGVYFVNISSKDNVVGKCKLVKIQ